EDGIRDLTVTGVQTCALPICDAHADGGHAAERESLAYGRAHVLGDQGRLGPAVVAVDHVPGFLHDSLEQGLAVVCKLAGRAADRSEERRVGKGCRCGGWRDQW